MDISTIEYLFAEKPEAMKKAIEMCGWFQKGAGWEEGVVVRPVVHQTHKHDTSTWVVRLLIWKCEDVRWNKAVHDKWLRRNHGRNRR